MALQVTSHWDRLPREIQEMIMKMTDRQLHRERLEQVCCVYHSDDIRVPITPCCPIHLYSKLRSVCMILDLNGYRISGQPFIVREMGWCDM